MIRRLLVARRRFWDRYERAWAEFGVSTHSSEVWTLFCIVWVVVEACRGKAPGFDGVGQWLLGEVGLATLRKLSR